MKSERLFQIIYLLLERQTVTAPELADLLEVSVRTIYRDIDALSASGIPVYTIPGKGGGISLLPGFTLDKSLLSDDEQNEMIFALQSLKAMGCDPERTIAKIGALFQKTAADWIEVDFSRWGQKKVDKDRFDIIRQAILEKRVLHIEYANSRGEISSRDICPARLSFKSKEWYLQGYCRKAEGYRTFKVNRILSMECTEQRVPLEFSDLPAIDDEVLCPWQMLDLELKVAPESVYRVYDEFEDSDIQQQEDGSFVVQARIPDGKWVLDYKISL